jgi:hypothetical protein
MVQSASVDFYSVIQTLKSEAVAVGSSALVYRTKNLQCPALLFSASLCRYNHSLIV